MLHCDSSTVHGSRIVAHGLKKHEPLQIERESRSRRFNAGAGVYLPRTDRGAQRAVNHGSRYVLNGGREAARGLIN